MDVEPGEALGIIGPNGAGKSTLLKILSRITQPTNGRAVIRGRVASLLEVGTGFHPDLTGRENVYLNGTLLGMKKREIDSKFDAIIDFSGCGEFIETPTKHYSSGMRVRLAFAVAAHLEPEVLIVDEVLAVGDAAFQRKCLGRLQTAAGQGRTVLFVSHNLAAVQHLCRQAIVMEAGAIGFRGDAQRAIEYYHQRLAPGADLAAPAGLVGTRPAWAIPHIRSARLRSAADPASQMIPLGGDAVIEMDVVCPDGTALRQPVMGVVLHHPVFGAVGGVNMRMTGHGEVPSQQQDWDVGRAPATRLRMRCRLRELPFLPGAYRVDLWLGDGSRDVDAVQGCLTLPIAATDVYGSGQLPFARLGVAFLKADWEMENAHECEPDREPGPGAGSKPNSPPTPPARMAPHPV